MENKIEIGQQELKVSVPDFPDQIMRVDKGSDVITRMTPFALMFLIRQLEIRRNTMLRSNIKSGIKKSYTMTELDKMIEFLKAHVAIRSPEQKG